MGNHGDLGHLEGLSEPVGRLVSPLPLTLTWFKIPVTGEVFSDVAGDRIMHAHAFPADFSILVIEDSEIDFLITEAQLRKALQQDFKLIWKQTFAEGLAHLLREPPHVGLVDYFIYEENGIDLIRMAREQGCQVPLILLTAKEDYQTDVSAMRAGADEYLVKRQLNPALLERVLRYISKVHRQRQEILELNQALEMRVNQRTAELISTNYALQESERRMELLKEIASVANASANIEEAFLETLASISHYTGWPLGHVALARFRGLDEDPFLEATELWYNADPARYHALIQATRELETFAQDSVLGKVLQHRSPAWARMETEDLIRFPRAGIARASHLKSHLAFPVIVNDQVMAVMEFFSIEVEESSEVMLKLMSEISHQLGYFVERKRAETALRLAQKRLTQAQGIARLGSFVSNSATGFFQLSPELQRMLQFPGEIVSLEMMQNRIHPDDREKVIGAYRLAREARVPFSLDHRYILPDGQEIHIHGQGEIEIDAQTHAPQLVGIMQDISERKRIEEVLVRMREAAESANQAKSAFLASMSHEIRTPMNAILGFAQILLRDPQTSGQQRQHLTTILRSGEHLLGLINDILEVSKIESGRISLHPHPFDLMQLMQDLQGMFSEKLASRRLSLNIQISENTPHYLVGDEAKLRQVLINLLSNAVKFTDSGGIEIRVGASPEGQGTRLFWEVEDTGCGIAADELHKVFSSFEQTASGIRSQSGTGLGMAISRSYVNLMGGSLELRSQEHVGTCFSFDLPFGLTSAAEVKAIENPRRVKSLAPSQATPKILLVDDRETNLALLREMLQPLGFELSQAENGAEALRAFEQFKPQAILMDSAMPVMNGLEATRAIRARADGGEVVIISISASAFEHDRASILAAGASDFLAKPVRESDLLAKLQSHLGLDYLYEDEAIATQAAPLTELSLAGVPAALRTRMQEALECGDLDTLAELASGLPPESAALADQIQAWAGSFAYDQLNTLFQGATV